MEKLHSVDEVAEAFGLPAATVRGLCKRRRRPHLQFGRTIRFTDAQLQEVIRIHAVEASLDEVKVLNLVSKGLTRRSAEYWVSRERRA